MPTKLKKKFSTKKQTLLHFVKILLIIKTGLKRTGSYKIESTHPNMKPQIWDTGCLPAP